MRKKVTNIFAPKQMSKKNIVKSLYTAVVAVLMVLVLLPSMFLIYVGGRVTSLIGYIGIAATIGEILLLMCPPDRAGKKPDPGSPNSSHELP